MPNHRDQDTRAYVGALNTITDLLTLLGSVLLFRLVLIVLHFGFQKTGGMVLAYHTVGYVTLYGLSAATRTGSLKNNADTRYYYRLKQTIGIPFLGIIGLFLFIALTISLAFFCTEFGNALARLCRPAHYISGTWAAVSILCLLWGSVWFVKINVRHLMNYVLLSFLLFQSSALLSTAANLHIQTGDILSLGNTVMDIAILATALYCALITFQVAPRLLQALSFERIFPCIRRLAKGYGRQDIPLGIVFLCFLISLLAIVFSNSKQIGFVMTVFFLISLGVFNFAVCLKTISLNSKIGSDFRQHRVDLLTGFLGGLTCAGLLIYLKPLAFAPAIFFVLWFYRFLSRPAGRQDRSV